MAEGAGVPSLAALEGTPLGWHAAGTLTGLSPGHGSQLLLTASGQGVEAVDGNTRATKSSWTLLNTALELPGPAAVLDPSSQHVAVPIRRTEAAAAKPDSLLVWPRSAPSGRLDAFPAIELTGKVAAVHPISGFLVLYKSGGCSHVVQGQGGLLSLRDVPDSLGDGGSSGVHVCSTATSEPGVAVVTAASSGDLEVCFISTDGGGLTRRMAEWKLQSTGSPHARPVSIAAVPGKLVLLWSDLTWQVISSKDGSVLLHRHLKALAPPPEEASAKKTNKRAATTQEPGHGRPPPAMCSLSPQHVAVVGTSGKIAAVAVLDSDYGCVHAFRRIPGEGGGAAATPPLCVPIRARERTCAISAGLGVFLAELQVAPVTLVDVVGALGPRATNAKQLFGADALRAMATGPRISHAAPQLRATKPLDKELDGNFIAEMLEDAPGLLNMEAMAPGERLECQTLEALDAMEEGKRPGEEALLKLLSPLLDRSHSASGTLRAAAMMAAVSGRHWKILRRLMRSQPLESLVYAPELAGALADANQFELLASLLAKARDLPPGQLTYVVSAILGDSNSPEALDGMQSHASKLRDKAEANLSAAEKAAPTDQKRPLMIATAKAAVMFVDGFTDAEICFHTLLSSDQMGLIIGDAVQRLDGLVADALLRYLGKWLRKLLVSEKVTLQARRALPFGMVLPTISQVVNWMALTMDCHMTRLLQQKSCRKILREVSELVDGEVRSLKALMLVEGAAKQIFSKAAMPSTQTIARKLYSVELLDISAMS